MNKLENSFVKFKTNFELVKREGNFAIFSRVGEDYPLSYEVVEVLSHNGREIAGVHIPATEFLPSNEQWGTKGFSYTKIEDAEDRLQKMIEEEKIKLTSKKSVVE